MADRYVYDFGEGRTMHLRSANWGEPNLEIRFVVRDGDKEIISPPLPEVQLSILAHAFLDYYFQRTGRIAWPAEPHLLHRYEQARQDAAERTQHLLAHLVTAPAPTVAEIDAAHELLNNEDPPMEAALAPVEPEPPMPPKENGATRRRIV